VSQNRAAVQAATLKSYTRSFSGPDKLGRRDEESGSRQSAGRIALPRPSSSGQSATCCLEALGLSGLSHPLRQIYRNCTALESRQTTWQRTPSAARAPTEIRRFHPRMWHSLRLYKTSYPRDFLDMQRRWLSLARCYEFSERLEFLSAIEMRDKEARLVTKTLLASRFDLLHAPHFTVCESITHSRTTRRDCAEWRPRVAVARLLRCPRRQRPNGAAVICRLALSRRIS
jgi:hypothetical protein